jgi:hypothetical protein
MKIPCRVALPEYRPLAPRCTWVAAAGCAVAQATGNPVDRPLILVATNPARSSALISLSPRTAGTSGIRRPQGPASARAASGMPSSSITICTASRRSATASSGVAPLPFAPPDEPSHACAHQTPSSSCSMVYGTCTVVAMTPMYPRAGQRQQRPRPESRRGDAVIISVDAEQLAAAVFAECQQELVNHERYSPWRPARMTWPSSNAAGYRLRIGKLTTGMGQRNHGNGHLPAPLQRLAEPRPHNLVFRSFGAKRDRVWSRRLVARPGRQRYAVRMLP